MHWNINISPSFQIPYKKVDRRAGDVASVYGNADLAKQELGWSASRDLKQMCKYDRDYCDNVAISNFLNFDISGKYPNVK